MLKKIFQSPIFNVFLIICMGLIILSKYYSEFMPEWLQIHPLLLVIPLCILIVMIPIYNKRNPKDRFQPQIVPLEMREEDEGLQWITYKATRKVYIFFALFIPVAILLTALLREVPYFPIILLCIMGVIQYVIFYLEMKRNS